MLTLERKAELERYAQNDFSSIPTNHKDLSNVGQDDEFETWSDLSKRIDSVKWLWKGWMAQGFPVIMAGEPGIGKSFLLLYMVGCVTNGYRLPENGGLANEGKVLWVETESAEALNLERAKTWGLDMTKVLRVKVNQISFDEPEHLEKIRRGAMREDVKLVIVDSLSAGTTRDARSSGEMQGLMGFFAELAKDTNKPLIITHHLRKRSNFDGEKITLDRLRDSSVIAQRARIIWAIDAPDDDDKENRRLYVIKNNLSRFPEEIGYRVTDRGLSFGNAPLPPRKETQLDRAMELLKTFLAKEPQKSWAIEEEAKNAAISMDTMRRAKEKLGINAVKVDNSWFWSLPVKMGNSDT